jgi:hypothetical protein
MFIALSSSAFCQVSENDAVKKVINTLFDSMRSGDTVQLRSTLADGAIIQVIRSKKDNADMLVTEKANELIKTVGMPHNDVYDEKVTFNGINISNNIATVWAPYKFYLGKKFSHCGIDVFQLMKTVNGWKIVSIFYDVRTGNCPE